MCALCLVWHSAMIPFAVEQSQQTFLAKEHSNKAVRKPKFKNQHRQEADWLPLPRNKRQLTWFFPQMNWDTDFSVCRVTKDQLTFSPEHWRAERPVLHLPWFWGLVGKSKDRATHKQAPRGGWLHIWGWCSHDDSIWAQCHLGSHNIKTITQ